MIEMKSIGMADALDEYLSDIATLDIHELYSSSEPLLSDDIWKKFQLDPVCDISDFDEMFQNLDGAIPEAFDTSGLREIRNHDCMWAGHCGSKEHPADEYKLLKTVPKLEMICPAPVTEKTPVVKQQQQQPVAAGRSLLLKTVVKNATPTVAATISPDSPPISDDEDQKGQTLTLKILNDAIDEFDIDEDSDLCEYFEEGEDLVTDPVDIKPPVSPPPTTAAKNFFNLQSDHCYHKDKNASMRMNGLGIETPSDSEEEIDVVSIGEKQTSFGFSRSCYALPTNPSNKDRQQLQRTMATAITNKRINNKTTSSLKRAHSNEINSKRRGIKRSRKVYKTSPNQSPYKKRAPISNSSDSEPELEKRSLHNNMERQRRIDLRNAFEELRVLVPQVNNKDRAAKVVILREAATYCDYLGDVSDRYNQKLIELRRQQERLRARVSHLRRNLASKR